MARTRKTRVFVSYSRHDEALVKPLAGLLGVAAGDAVFLDVSSLKPGDLWDEKILGAVKQASVFVLCWCCACEGSSFVAKEIAAALATGEKKLVPVLFCSAPLPAGMAERQWIDLRGKIVHECPTPHNAPHKKRSSSQHKINRVRDPRVVLDDWEDPFATPDGDQPLPPATPPPPSYAAPAPRPAPAPQRIPPPQPAPPIDVSVAAEPSVRLGLLLRRAFQGIWAQQDRRRAETIAATATSYFEGLAARTPGGDANP